METKLSSLVWICTYSHAASLITVLDANNPAEILNSFGVCANHVLCIASVPGASLSDYRKTFTKITISEIPEDSSDNVETENSENNTTSLPENSKSNEKANEEQTEAVLVIQSLFYRHNITSRENAINENDIRDRCPSGSLFPFL